MKKLDLLHHTNLPIPSPGGYPAARQNRNTAEKKLDTPANKAILRRLAEQLEDKVRSLPGTDKGFC